MTRFLIWAFVAVYFITQISVASYQENVCRYRKKVIKLGRRKKVFSRHCRRETKNCNDPDFPTLRCTTDRCYISVSWVLNKQIYYRKVYGCCQGWAKGYRNDYNGCLKVTCISLPQDTPKPCLEKREAKLNEIRQIYTLTTPPKTAPETNAQTIITDENLLDFVTFPVLNVSTSNLIQMTLTDPHERGWANVYLAMSKRNKAILAEMYKPENVKVFKNFSDYAQLLDYNRKRQHDGGPFDQYFRYPSQEEDFKDIITSDVWQNDQVFTEQRFAGLDPMSLRKLKLKDYMDRRSHFSSELDNAFERVIGQKTTLFEMIKIGAVYVLDYPLMVNLTNVPDILDFNTTDGREMKASKSPTAIFVPVKNYFTKKYELKPVAIQTDYDASSPVFTPADGLKWLLAKEEIQRADSPHAQLIEHLLKTHLVMESICVTIKRTFSEYHPLFELFKWHCRGVLMTNGVGLPALLKSGRIMHSLFSFGHIGSIELLNKGYADLSWEDVDFEKNLKKRGIDDTEKLPYFPYRDDGIVIWRLIEEFANTYVNLYYHSENDVKQDMELKNFANELSDQGVGPNGGLGMMKGFPAKITTKQQLKEIVTRIVFLPIQHHAVNYPVVYYTGFVPNMPTKLYDDPRAPPHEFSFYNLPGYHVAAAAVSIAMNLGSLRYDKLFDYSSQLIDKRGKRTVYEFYTRLMGPVQRELRRRNKQRLQDGHLTYPYFLPGWMPNSIHT